MKVIEMRFVDSYKNKRKVVYTTIIGKYDKLKEPKVISEGFDYVCFTDDVELNSKIWKINVVDNPEGLDNKRLSSKINILCNFFLKEYDLSIMIGGQISINCDLNIFLDENYHGEDMVTFRHPDRSCIYEEAKVCIAIGKDDPEIINKQMEGYRSKGFPERIGLVASGIMIRNHDSKKLGEFMNRWWKEVCFKSKRDQLSFNFILWKYPLSIGYLDFTQTFASNFSLGPHEHEKRKFQEKQYQNEIKNYKNKLRKYQDEIKKSEKELYNIKNSKTWKALQYYVRFKKFFNRKKF